MDTEVPVSSVISPGRYAAMLRRWWWLLVVVSLLGGGTAYWLSSQQQAIYETTLTLFVSPASPSSNDVTAARLMTKTYSELVTSKQVLDQVISRLNLNQTSADLADRIEASAVLDTQIIEVSVSASDPQLVANIANATGEEFTTWIREQQSSRTGQNAMTLAETLAETKGQIEAASAQLVSLRSQGSSANTLAQIEAVSGQLRQLQDQYSGLLEMQQQIQFTREGSVLVTSPAEIPTMATSPQPLRDATLALLLSLGISLVALLLLERGFDWIRSPLDIEGRVRPAILGVVPAWRSPDPYVTVTEPASRLSDAVLTVQATLQAAVAEQSSTVMLLDPVDADASTSLLALNLGAAFAQAGHTAVVVDADIRRKQALPYFDGASATGFSTLFEQPGSRVSELLADSPVKNLWLLGVGQAHRQKVEVLSADRLKAVIQDLRAMADVVVIAGPPAFEPEALVLARQADLVLVTAIVNRTRMKGVRALLKTLDLIRSSVVGIVLLEPTRKGERIGRNLAPSRHRNEERPTLALPDGGAK